MAGFTQLCQLAADWRGTLPGEGTIAEPKIDGWRCLYAPGIDGKPRLWTRNGMPLQGADHVLYRLRLMDEAAGEPMVFDGEVQVDGSLTATKAWFERGFKLGGEAGTFHAFDCLTVAEWKAGGTPTPLFQRKARLTAIARQVDTDPALSWEWRPGSRGRDEGATPVRVLPDSWCVSAGDVVDMARRIWAEGGEGVVVKDYDSPYRRNRNGAWQKVKMGGPWLRNMAA